ncbi:hypothetical protein, partial [Streptomyces sp. NPDC059639]|uniref:hypothetical protein n=1 Tax=Streptomyces sp. NPDC059639 TaxID=3346891 RepID=UPI0036B852C7
STMKAGDGVSTYLALIFGTLLSSQGTDASFVLTLSGFPPGASLRYFVFPTLPDPFSVPFPVRICFQWPLEGLCLSADPTLSEVLGRSDRLFISELVREASRKKVLREAS